MGFIQPKRIQVKLLKPDLALALTWWSVSFQSFLFEKSSVCRTILPWLVQLLQRAV
jgi:hypothetical protein